MKFIEIETEPHFVDDDRPWGGNKSYLAVHSRLLIKLLIRVLGQRCYVLGALQASVTSFLMLTGLSKFVKKQEEPSERITHNNDTGVAAARGHCHATYTRGRLMQTCHWLPNVYCQNASGQLMRESASVLAAAHHICRKIQAAVRLKDSAKILVLLAVLEEKWNDE